MQLQLQLAAWARGDTDRRRNLTDADQLISSMSRELGALIKDGRAFFPHWERIVIYHDNGQEITNVVLSWSLTRAPARTLWRSPGAR